MSYRFNGKFHRADKHTLEERKEMGCLINAGVPYRVIENAYGVNPHTLRVVSQGRDQWLNGQLARTEEEKFAYAQQLYCVSQNDKLRTTVDDAVLKPFARRIADRLLMPAPREKLLEEILGENPRASKEHRERVFQLTYALMLKEISAGKTYRDEENAIWGLTLPVNDALRASETPALKSWRILRDAQLDKHLATLTETEQDVIRKFYGIHCAQRSLVEIAASYDGRPKQWAHKLKNDALDQIRPEVRGLYETLVMP